MSVREGKIMALAGGTDFANKTREELRDMFRKVLNNGMHGLCFSPYEEGQKPGDILTENQIRRRIREAFRLNKPSFNESMADKRIALMVIYTEKEILDFKLIQSGLIKGFRKISSALKK